MLTGGCGAPLWKSLSITDWDVINTLNRGATEIVVIMAAKLHGVTKVQQASAHRISLACKFAQDQRCINNSRTESLEQTVDSAESNITMYG